jgi:hypothetical protein
VDFAAGTKDVFVTYPAEKSVNYDASDNVGIGNTAPGYKLEVTGDIRAGSGGDVRLGSATGTTTALGDSVLYNDANNLVFSTGTTTAERFRIGSVGQWGIGGATYGSAGQVFTSGGASAAPTWTTPTTGTVTSVSGTGTVNGITLTGTVTSSGSLTLGGTLSGVSLTSQVSGTLPVTNGGTGTATAFTTGSIVFAGASGVYSQSNSQFFWDNSNNRLGVGNASPGATLDVTGNIRLSAGSPNIEFNNGGPMVYSPAANTLAFATGGGPSSPIERMRIDSAGCVGIGLSTIDATFHISGIRGGNGRMTQSSSKGTSQDNLNIIASSSSGSVDQWFSYGVTSGYNFFIQSGVGSGSSGLVITSGNSVLVNESSPSAASLVHNFEVNGDIMSTGSVAGLFWANRQAAPSSGSDWYGWYTASGTIYLYNPAAGNIASINASTGAYTALSDAAKKKDFEPSAVGLDAILALKPTLFRMETDADDAPKQLGFIAQEVKDHIPQAYVEEQNTDAVGNENTYIGLNDRPIIAALVKAVQELEARVAQLEGN